MMHLHTGKLNIVFPTIQDQASLSLEQFSDIANGILKSSDQFVHYHWFILFPQVFEKNIFFA